ELRRRGVVFETSSDSEVVLQSYLEWGADFVSYLEGMFSVAIWDVTNKELILARDHLGIKPLFYFTYLYGVIFGSEPKALLTHPLVHPEVDLEGLAELLGLWPYKTPGHGIYKGMREVRPGELVRFRRSHAFFTRYWTPQVRPHVDNIQETVAKVRALLEAAVESHLVSDVPICSLLSGGVDSTSITALAVRHLTSKQLEEFSTFSIDFDRADESFRPSAFRPDRDAPFVKIASTELKTKHYEVLLSSQETIAEHGSALTARDLPDTADMDASLYLLFRHISRYFKVSISGEGADEIFGGYPWYAAHVNDPLDSFPWIKYLCFEQSLLTPEANKQLRLAEYVSDRFSEVTKEVSAIPHESAQDRRMRLMSYLDLSRFLPGQLERKDRMSMGNGVEARVPFCDRRLVEYVWNIPWTIKMVGGVEKGVLRRAVSDLIPPAIASRRKCSYPTTFDPTYEKALSMRVRKVLDDKGSFILELIDRSRVSALLDGVGKAPFSRPSVWMGRLVSLYDWFTKYKIKIAA
ncbi:MAG: asparagine synthase (glutamine-hydrolyzing), partial [Thermoproteota archaeon]|nr:asparagine synthase (glutamine-hydrolyzing) [Thermoproteota archaeon]